MTLTTVHYCRCVLHGADKPVLTVVDVCQMVVTNLHKLNKAIMGDKPLFQIDVLLAMPDIVLNPQANEMFKLTIQCVRDTMTG